MKTSATVKEIFGALVKAQSEIKGAIKDQTNPFFKSKYADLSSVIDEVRGPFSKHELFFLQSPYSTLEGTFLSARICHSSGEWIEFDGVLVPVTKVNDPQVLKSGITLMRRAQLLSIVGMSEQDDDGNRAIEALQAPNNPKVHFVTPKPHNHAPGASNEVPWPEERPYIETSGDYIIPLGKYKGMRLDEVTSYELDNYIKYLDKSAKEKGKPLTGAILELTERAEAYLKTLEKVNPLAGSQFEVPQTN